MNSEKRELVFGLYLSIDVYACSQFFFNYLTILAYFKCNTFLVDQGSFKNKPNTKIPVWTKVIIDFVTASIQAYYNLLLFKISIVDVSIL